jgi:hypothetical protein
VCEPPRRRERELCRPALLADADDREEEAGLDPPPREIYFRERRSAIDQRDAHSVVSKIGHSL